MPPDRIVGSLDQIGRDVVGTDRDDPERPPVGADQHGPHDRTFLLVLDGAFRVGRRGLRHEVLTGEEAWTPASCFTAACATKTAPPIRTAMVAKSLRRRMVPGRGCWIMFRRSFSCGGASHGMHIGTAFMPMMCSKVCVHGSLRLVLSGVTAARRKPATISSELCGDGCQKASLTRLSASKMAAGGSVRCCGP